jgi:hypothetical protein
MNSKIITAVGAVSLMLGMFALQGCYDSNYYPGYGGYGGGYGGYSRYGYGSNYYEPAPVIVGDNDEHREWHEHHEEWRGHDGGHDHDRDEHARAGREHDHDRD